MSKFKVGDKVRIENPTAADEAHEVAQVSSDGSMFQVSTSRIWFDTKFFDLVEPAKIKHLTVACSAKDLSDWRVWAQATVSPGCCACGINRRDCEYHR